MTTSTGGTTVATQTVDGPAVTVTATDNAGNTSSGGSATVTTAGDATAPTNPGSAQITAGTLDDTSVEVTWNPSTDAIGVNSSTWYHQGFYGINTDTLYEANYGNTFAYELEVWVNANGTQSALPNRVACN